MQNAQPEKRAGQQNSYLETRHVKKLLNNRKSGDP